MHNRVVRMSFLEEQVARNPGFKPWSFEPRIAGHCCPIYSFRVVRMFSFCTTMLVPASLKTSESDASPHSCETVAIEKSDMAHW